LYFGKIFRKKLEYQFPFSYLNHLFKKTEVRHHLHFDNQKNLFFLTLI
jgi:hypothetical protein